MNPLHTPPHVTRAELLRRYAVLLFMTMATLLLTTIGYFLILGYQLDPQEQTLTQGGLVKFDSYPNGAFITLDHDLLSPKTAHQQTVPAGQHQANFSLQDYRPWQAKFTVAPGKVSWIDYARFVPKSITTQDLKTFSRLDQNLISPNRQYHALITAADQPVITILDLADSEHIKTTEITLPPETITIVPGKPSTFVLHEWQLGSDYLTLKHIYGDNQVEFLRLQRSTPRNIINISSKLGSPFSDLHFAGNSHDEFYALSEGSLRKINVAGNGTLSAPIASHVTHFRSFKADGVIYVTTQNNSTVIEVNIKNTKITLTSTTKPAPISIDLGMYYENFYAAVAIDKKLTIYKVNLNDKRAAFYATIPLEATATWADFSPTNRYIIAGHDTTYTVYDIDTKLSYHETSRATRHGQAGMSLDWLDESYLVFDADDQLAIRDYTGQNKELIAPGLTGYDSALSKNQKNLFFVARGEGESRIIRQARMVVE